MQAFLQKSDVKLTIFYIILKFSGASNGKMLNFAIHTDILPQSHTQIGDNKPPPIKHLLTFADNTLIY